MKTLLWIIAVLIVVGICVFGYFIVNFVFVSNITEFKSQRGTDYKLEDDMVSIKELPNPSQQVIDAEGFEDKAILASDLPTSTTMSLTPKNELKIQNQLFENEENTSVLLLTMTQSGRELVFVKNKIYLKLGEKLGELLWKFNEFRQFYFINYIDENTLLVAASWAKAEYSETRLWQLNLTDFSKVLLTKEPYYIFNRPPKVLTLDNETVLAIYYTGDYSFGFGGPVSRPQKSTVRLYSSQYPSGHDLATINYKGGTVIDARLEANALILTADPSRPYMLDDRERPARFWQLSRF